jgi:hypothetical protein
MEMFEEMRRAHQRTRESLYVALSIMALFGGLLAYVVTFGKVTLCGG